MVYDYVVTLKNSNRRYIDNISILVSLASVAFLLSDQLQHGFSFIKGFACIFVFLLIAWNIYFSYVKGATLFYSRALLVAGIGWFAMPFMFWVGLPIIALGLIEKLAKSNLEIGFSSGEIVINSLIKRKFKWSDFNNIVLKDDLLTMDFKNNRLLQRMTIEDEPDADEDEFNEYCHKHLLNAI